MTTQGSLDFRSEIGRCLEAFTRGEIDFQALLAAVDRITAENPAARAEAISVIDHHETTGALQRTFFRVLRERLVASDGSEGSVALQAPEPPANAAAFARPLEPAPNSHRFEQPDPIRAFELAGRVARPDGTVPFEPPRRTDRPDRNRDFDLSGTPGRADRPEPAEPIARPGAGEQATEPARLSDPVEAGKRAFEPVEAPEPESSEPPADATVPFELAGRPAPAEQPAPVELDDEPEPSDRTMPFELPAGRPGQPERPQPRARLEAVEPPVEITRAPPKKSRFFEPDERFVARRRVDQPAFERADDVRPAPEPPTAKAKIPPRMPPMRAQPMPGLVEPRSFITERRTSPKHQSQKMAWAGAFLIIALLLGLVVLGPLNGVFPKLAALVTREIPDQFKREAAKPPQGTGEKSVEVAPPADDSAPAAAVGNAAPAANETIPPDSTTGAAEQPRSSSVSSATAPAPQTAPPSATAEPQQPTANAAASPPETQTQTNPSAGQTTRSTAESGSQSSMTETQPRQSTDTRLATAAPTPQSSAATAQSRVSPQARAESDAAAPAGPGRFALAARAYTVNEGKGVVAIAIVRHDGSHGPVNITWWTTPETAKPGDDYADFGYRTESFANGETQRVIYVPIASDEIAEPRETFTVHITNATNGAQLESPTTATVTIVDDD